MAGFRYRFYVDGFNVYHALFPWFPQYLWLNYYRLAQRIVCADDTVSSVTYFSAYAEWKSHKSVMRHKQYVSALKAAGVGVTLGRFKVSEEYCKKIEDTCVDHQEKRTDVNIALAVLCDAIRGNHDRSVIVTADTDFIPAIEAVRQVAPKIQVGIMTPLLREHRELIRAAHFHYRMSESALADSQFPKDIHVAGGIVKRPDYERMAADWIAAHPKVKDPRVGLLRGGLDA